MKNGNVYNIGQTVNGISKFLWLNDKWYYFREDMSREYEYDQQSLTDTVLNLSGLEDITFIKNIFK